MRSRDLYLEAAARYHKTDIDIVAISIIMTERNFRSRIFRAFEYLLLISTIAFGRTRYSTTIGMSQVNYALWIEIYETHPRALYNSLSMMENYELCKLHIQRNGCNSIKDILYAYNGANSAIYTREFNRHYAQIGNFHRHFVRLRTYVAKERGYRAQPHND